MIISKLTAQLTLCLLFLLLWSAVPSGTWTSGEDWWLTKSTIHFLLPDLDRKQTFLIKSICFEGILAAENLPTAEFSPPASLPCRNYILPGWFMDGTVWVLFLLCLVFAHLIETSKIKGCWCWGDRRGGMAMCGSTNSLKIQEYSCFNSLTMNHAKQLSEENTQLLSMKQLKHQWKVCLQHSFIFLRKMKDLWIASLNNYAVTG